nr:hypothetical protein CFP56_11117 [Quercus suber]
MRGSEKATMPRLNWRCCCDAVLHAISYASNRRSPCGSAVTRVGSAVFEYPNRNNDTMMANARYFREDRLGGCNVWLAQGINDHRGSGVAYGASSGMFWAPLDSPCSFHHLFFYPNERQAPLGPAHSRHSHPCDRMRRIQFKDPDHPWCSTNISTKPAKRWRERHPPTRGAVGQHHREATLTLGKPPLPAFDRSWTTTALASTAD